MAKFFGIILSVNMLVMASCKSQIDIEKLQYGESVVEVLKNVDKKEKDREVQNGVLSYRTEELNHFKYGEVVFSDFVAPDGYASDYSYADFYVDSYESNQYLGITLEIAKEEEGTQLVNYLKKQNGDPEVLYLEEDMDKNFGRVYVWQDDKNDQVILLEQRSNETKDSGKYIRTRCVIAQKDLRVENSTDLNVFTLLEQFKMPYSTK
ncbi:hypothetical protein [Sinomicrobium sp.]